MSANVGSGKQLAPGEPIQLFFDRLLLPSSATRQTFVLTDLEGNYLDPTVTYDPVARMVQVAPTTPLQTCQLYRLTLEPPQSPTDPNGVRAIDHATLPPSPRPPVIEFQIAGLCGNPRDAGADADAMTEAGAVDATTDAGATDAAGEGSTEAGVDATTDGAVADGAVADGSTDGSIDGATDAGPTEGGPVTAPPVDFCSAVLPLFVTKCSSSTCHGGPLPLAGLRLDSSQGIADTAIGRAAQGANTGPRSATSPPSLLFGQDMPIVSKGSPASSWLIYKLLLAVPAPCSTVGSPPPACSATSPTVMHNAYSEPWTDMSAAERARLGNYVLGREMPFPYNWQNPPGVSPTQNMTLDELETVSWWIAQGATVDACQ